MLCSMTITYIAVVHVNNSYTLRRDGHVHVFAGVH